MVTAAIVIGIVGALLGYLTLGAHLQDRRLKRAIKRIDAMSQEEVDAYLAGHNA